ncbi:maternal effect protein oskar [Bactrocera dorsalis]|uniref:Maternal EFFECT protein oskar n=1 Tax=Bactrocera dorsalis TaxID=27457 RepID=A0A034WRF5_BACDO|nr:maternal effect protein oskar [Bactrocera dorsalis]XP_049304756.1 maternal effect protein oskar [Bactrocera dorsalis]
MTIMHEAFLELRSAFPDLDAEVRSILLTRSQDGATISDIKDDYRKNTGIVFPIFQNITEFLLSIPFVTAFCNENGKLIFNVQPSARTKHIYDLVQQQKPQHQLQTQKHQQFVQYNDQNRFEPFVNNISSKKNERDEFWYRNNKQTDCQKNNEYINKKNIDNNEFSESANIDVVKTKVGLENLTSLQTNAHKGVFNYTEETGRNNYYQDNCNHLFNRLCNQPKMASQNLGHNFNNIHYSNQNNRITKQQSTYSQAKTISQTSQFRSIQQQNYLNTNKLEKQPNPYKESMAKYIPPSTSRPISPSCTKSSRYNDSIYTTDSDYEAHLLDFPLLGDDFFLFLARMELRCKFKKYDKILQSGLCVSGQTICGAIKRVRQLEDQCKSIIVNIGSVDIMKGRPLVQIEHDFRELINLMFKKGFTPILTTLAPLANFAHDEITKTKLERFNNFIKKEGEFLLVMDIWACLVNERGHILFDCFQNEPRIVTGTSEPYVFWNKIGRQRVLQLIESQLEY